MIEFLIRRTDGDPSDFNLPHSRYPEVLRPNSIPSRPVEGWGSHRIEVAGCEVSFSDEIAGFQVCFETGEIAEETARQLVEEICRNLMEATGDRAEVLRI